MKEELTTKEMYFTYLRRKQEDEFTIILHSTPAIEHEKLTINNECRDMVLRYISDVHDHKEDNWYLKTIEITENMLPFSPVTWADKNSNII